MPTLLTRGLGSTTTGGGTVDAQAIADLVIAGIGTVDANLVTVLGAAPDTTSPVPAAVASIANNAITTAAFAAGTTLPATALDAIAVTAPTGVAATFPQMVVQTWRRFFKKTTRNRTTGTVKTYADDRSTVVTTQDATDDGVTQTQGAAE